MSIPHHTFATPSLTLDKNDAICILLGRKVNMGFSLGWLTMKIDAQMIIKLKESRLGPETASEEMAQLTNPIHASQPKKKKIPSAVNVEHLMHRK
jgi:hypothetical protein